MQMTRVRIRATRQVLEMVPDVARAMINGGTAELVTAPATKAKSQPETMAVAAVAERAVAPAQKPASKTGFSRKRA